MRGHNYKLFIFDMDGTLLDKSHGILQAARHTIEVFHKNMPCDEMLRTFIGQPLRSSFGGLPEVSVDEIDDMVKCFRKQKRQRENISFREFLTICHKLPRCAYGTGV